MEGRNLGFKSMIWNIRKKKKIRTTRRKTLKNEDSISSLWDNFRRANKRYIPGVPEGEKKEQEMEYLHEKIMKGNFPNLTKEINMQVQEA